MQDLAERLRAAASLANPTEAELMIMAADELERRAATGPDFVAKTRETLTALGAELGLIDARQAVTSGQSPAAGNPSWRATHREVEGGLCRVLFEARHGETGEMLTIYQTEEGEKRVQSSAAFNAILPDGRRRFEPVA